MKKIIRFLLVDDDVEEQDIFKEALKEVNVATNCITALHGEEGLALLHGSEHLPDFIFLDLNMPRMNGLACLKLLKNDALLKTIPVVIYTTSYEQKDEKETIRLGAAHYMTKPTSISGLRKEIESIMSANELADQWE